jgi:hypothetical protein
MTNEQQAAIEQAELTKVVGLAIQLRAAEKALTAREAELAEAKARELALRRAINAYRAGIMALNPALSEALFAHLPAPQGGDSEF